MRFSVAANATIAVIALSTAVGPADAQIRITQEPYGYGAQGYGPGDPIVNVNRNGTGYVNLRNGCVVTFNRDGRRIADTRRCNSQMRSYAQRLFQDRYYGATRYRGRNDYGRNYRGGYGAPNVSMYGNLIRVDFGGLRCSYTYNYSGQHVSTIGRGCNGRLRGIANDAVRDFRRGRGWY